MIFALPALAEDPGQVAVDFLEKVRQGKVDLKAGADTALSPHITDAKRRLIEETVENLTNQIGKGKLSAGNIRVDGELAGVMVIQGLDGDQGQLQVYPVALVKGKNGWRPAPVLASFENAVSAYTVSLRERLSTLETWMMQQRVLEIEELMMRATARMREQIRSSIKSGELTNSKPVELLDMFQKAYQEGRQMEVLGYVGGYSEQWPADWESRTDAIRRAFSSKVRARYPWRLLASPDVVRVVVNEAVEKDEAMISLACLDPQWVGESRELGGIHLVHFSFAKNKEGHWRLDLPESLLQDDKESFLSGQGLDEDLLEVFAENFKKSSPSKFAPQVEQADQEVMRLLEYGSGGELLRWVDLEQESKAARESCVSAMRDWWSIRSPAIFCSPVKIDSLVEGDWAVTMYHWFSLNQVEHVELKPMFFRKVEKGWVWFPGKIRNLDPAVGKTFSDWIKAHQAQWQANAMKNSLESLVSLKRLDLNAEVKDGEVTELVRKWTTALKKKNIRDLMSLSARLGDDGALSHKLFRNLAYELSLAQRIESDFMGVYRAGKWVAAGFSHGEDARKIISLMIVVPTEHGIKMLPEIDLISDGNRTRKFLNKVALDRLKSHVSEGELEEIKGFFDDFEEKSR